MGLFYCSATVAEAEPMRCQQIDVFSAFLHPTDQIVPITLAAIATRPPPVLERGQRAFDAQRNQQQTAHHNLRPHGLEFTF